MRHLGLLEIKIGIKQLASIGRLLATFLQANASARITSKFRARLLLICSTAILALFLTTYLVFVFAIPTRTPFLILSCTYKPPFDLNPWADESIAAFDQLNRHNLSVESIKNVSSLIHEDWTELDDLVLQLDHFASKGKPFLVYIDQHVLVNSKGQPCLIADESEYLDEETWLPLPRIVDRISARISKERPLVMFLGCNRQPDMLGDAGSDVDLASSLRRFVESTDVHDSDNRELCIIAVLNDCDTVRSRSLQHLYRSFAMAISGECDKRSTGGNGNHVIELEELISFLTSSSDHHDSFHQSPDVRYHVFRNTSKPIAVAWTSNQPSMTNQTLPRVDESNIAMVAGIWNRYGQLQNREPWSIFQPNGARYRI